MAFTGFDRAREETKRDPELSQARYTFPFTQTQGIS
jgi:hypothetical protein